MPCEIISRPPLTRFSKRTLGRNSGALALFMEVDAARTIHGDGPSRFFLNALTEDDPLKDGIVDLRE